MGWLKPTVSLNNKTLLLTPVTSTQDCKRSASQPVNICCCSLNFTVYAQGLLQWMGLWPFNLGSLFQQPNLKGHWKNEPSYFNLVCLSQHTSGKCAHKLLQFMMHFIICYLSSPANRRDDIVIQPALPTDCLCCTVL